MTSDDLFTTADKKQPPAPKPALSNVPEMSVADLALSLKQTLEQTYGRIRVRGELAGLKLAASGHLYGDIKDVDANINIICWRGTMSKLSLKPEEGMDVIITGRVSSYPKSSRYQIIVESMELAGEGALLKMLEERRKKLTAEGLFAPERKKKLPFLPTVIGVVTSPTGAVIQDIMHRLRDRFPRHVLVWPVNVQGQGAAEQIAAAINGFDAIEKGSAIPRPDLIIVARGGGSLEDLMPFNEEIVVRAAAACAIPLISAVGHETDTTLIDYAADYRAPTPTAAAEIAVPLRINLMAQIQDDQERLTRAAGRLIENAKNILSAQTARLGDPSQILENKTQHVDYLGDKLSASLKNLVQVKKSVLQDATAKMPNPMSAITQRHQSLTYLSERLVKTPQRLTQDKKSAMEAAGRILQSLSPKGVLSRGYALVYDAHGGLVRNSQEIRENDGLTIEFANEDKIAVKAQKPN